MSRSRGFRLAICAAVAVLSLGVAASELVFEPDSTRYPHAVTFQVALCDLDGDGDLDAVFANQGSTPSRVLLNDGTGRFAMTDQLLTPQGHGVALGDLDGDGDLDIVIACASLGGPGRPSRVYLNDGAGAFTDTAQALGGPSLSGNFVQLVDIDGDDDLDAFIAFIDISRNTFVSRVFLNDGTGAFAESEYTFPFGTIFHDLDGDGDVDALAKVPGSGYTAWLNDGLGQFTISWEFSDATVWYEPGSFAFGDLNGDGHPDVLDTNGTWTGRKPTYVLIGDGRGSFDRRLVEIGGLLAAWPVLADLDGDGFIDASITCLGEPDRVWLGDGEGGFVDSGLRLGGNAMTTGHAVGDLDGDGDLDLFIPVYGLVGGPAVVWRNEAP